MEVETCKEIAEEKFLVKQSLDCKMRIESSGVMSSEK